MEVKALFPKNKLKHSDLKSSSGEMYTFVKCSQSLVVHIDFTFICAMFTKMCLMFTYCSKAQAFWLHGEEDLARQGLNISCSLERERKSDVSFSSNIFL